MSKRVVGADEVARLKSLHQLEILDSPAEERFDRITRIAKHLFEVPTVLISLVDDERQWFKSIQGLDACSTPRDISFCQHAILSDDALVIEDALLDPRFKDNPLVCTSPHIRFYGGQPIKAPDGHRVGTLCLIDSVPRTLGPGDIEMLKDLAALVEVELGISRLSQSQRELREALAVAERMAAIDALTQAWNRRAIFDILNRELDRASRHSQPVSVAYVDLDLFKPINDTYGHKVGDVVLKTLTQRLRRGIRLYDAVGRLGGDEFLLVIPGAGVKEGRIVADRVLSGVCDQPVVCGDRIIPISVSIGLATYLPGQSKDAEALVDRADQALFGAKGDGRGCVVPESQLPGTLSDVG